jgi:hypothetical protein
MTPPAGEVIKTNEQGAPKSLHLYSFARWYLQAHSVHRERSEAFSDEDFDWMFNTNVRADLCEPRRKP